MAGNHSPSLFNHLNIVLEQNPVMLFTRYSAKGIYSLTLQNEPQSGGWPSIPQV